MHETLFGTPNPLLEILMEVVVFQIPARSVKVQHFLWCVGALPGTILHYTTLWFDVSDQGVHSLTLKRDEYGPPSSTTELNAYGRPRDSVITIQTNTCTSALHQRQPHELWAIETKVINDFSPSPRFRQRGRDSIQLNVSYRSAQERASSKRLCGCCY